MKELTNITKALADESRIRILAALDSQELCVCQITELLQLAPSTVSKHLFLLKQAGLIDSRKDGRWIHYRLPGREATALVHKWLRVLLATTRTEETCCEDRNAIQAILMVDADELCCKQRISQKKRTGKAPVRG